MNWEKLRSPTFENSNFQYFCESEKKIKVQPRANIKKSQF